MTGHVNSDLEPRLTLVLLNAEGLSHEIEAVIDTGFNGFLTLPSTLISTLNLPWLCQEEGVLADGTVQVFDVYVTNLLWDGQPCRVETQASDTTPLVGMSLVQGKRLEVEVVPGGTVTIDSLR